MAETEVTSATTKNMAQQPQQFADQQSANYAPGYTPGGWAEQQTPGTSPFYQAPVAAQYNQQLVEQKKSFSWGKWILISFLSFLLLAVLVGGVLFSVGKRAVEQAMKQAAGENSGSQGGASGRPSTGGAGEVPVSEGQIVTLESLKYPGATVVESVKAPFVNTIRMTTDDDLQTVKNYYDKKFGETFKGSATNIQSQDNEKFVYIALSQPQIIIEVEPDANEDGKTRISIAKTSAPIPNLEKLKELIGNQ